MKNSKLKTKNSKKRIDIDHISNLADLKLSNKESQKFEKQLSTILDYFSKLQKLNTKNIEPLAHAAGIKNIQRKDQPRPSLSQQQVLANTKNKQKGFFKIKAIFEWE